MDAIDDIARTVKGKPQFDNALSTQYINVVYDIAARNPRLSEFQNKRIQSVLKAHRMSVLKDGNAPKRLRAFAAISLLGNRIALKVVVARNRKWKVLKGEGKKEMTPYIVVFIISIGPFCTF